MTSYDFRHQNAGSNTAVSASDPPEFTDSDATALLAITSSPPDLRSIQPLRLPVALPQTNVAYDAAFERAWNDELIASGIAQDEWLSFIDGLNIATTTAPPVRVVTHVGKILGFIPAGHPLHLASTAMTAGGKAAGRAISKTLTDRYVAKANETYFAPRGLRVHIMKTSAAKHFLTERGLSTHAPSASTSKLENLERQAEVVALQTPILRKIIPKFQEPTERLPTNTDVHTERLTRFTRTNPPSALAISTHSLPKPRIPESAMDQKSSLAVKLDIESATKQEAKNKRARQMLDVAQGRAAPDTLDQEFWDGISDDHEDELARSLVEGIPSAGVPNPHLPERMASGSRSSSSSSSDSSSSSEDEHSSSLTSKQQAKLAKRQEKRVRKQEQRVQKQEEHYRKRHEDAQKDLEKTTRKIETQVHTADRLEQLRDDDLLWLVLLNESDETLISMEGTEDADSQVSAHR